MTTDRLSIQSISTSVQLTVTLAIEIASTPSSNADFDDAVKHAADDHVAIEYPSHKWLYQTCELRGWNGPDLVLIDVVYLQGEPL